MKAGDYKVRIEYNPRKPIEPPESHFYDRYGGYDALYQEFVSSNWLNLRIRAPEGEDWEALQVLLASRSPCGIPYNQHFMKELIASHPSSVYTGWMLLELVRVRPDVRVELQRRDALRRDARKGIEEWEKGLSEREKEKYEVSSTAVKLEGYKFYIDIRMENLKHEVISYLERSEAIKVFLAARPDFIRADHLRLKLAYCLSYLERYDEAAGVLREILAKDTPQLLKYEARKHLQFLKNEGYLKNCADK